MKNKFALLLFVPTLAFANPNDFATDAQVAAEQYQHIQQTIDSAHLTPNQVPGYVANPAATRYARDPDAIAQDSIQALNNDQAGMGIVDEFNGGKDITINPKDKSLQTSFAVQQDASALAQGKAGANVPCTLPGNCTVKKWSATCLVSHRHDVNCYTAAKVKIEEQPFLKPVPVPCTHIVSLQTGQRPPAGAVLLGNMGMWIRRSLYQVPGPNSDNACYLPGSFRHVKGTVATPDIRGTSSINVLDQATYFFYTQDWNYAFYVTGTLSAKVDGKTVASVQVSGNQPAKHAIWIANKDRAITLEADAKLTGKGGYESDYYTYWVAVPRGQKHKAAVVTWVNSCTRLPTSCTRTKHTCKTPGSTRMFSGIPVTESCWVYQDDYHCGPTGQPVNTCGPLINAGCTMVFRQCMVSAGNFCQQTRDTYHCQKKTCTGHTNICVGNIFCIDGKCYENKPSQSTSKDFAKAGSEMAAAGAAAEQAKGNTDPNQVAIFAGEAMHCSYVALGADNCCAASGWAHNAHLMHCSDEQKRLGKLREKGYAFEIQNGDNYCSHQIGPLCTVHSRGFCVFKGLMAKDVQVQGRGQIGLSFNDAENPDCRGLTIAEFQRIDFSKIDFSNIYQDVKNNTHFPNSDAIRNRIIHDLGQRQ